MQFIPLEILYVLFFSMKAFFLMAVCTFHQTANGVHLRKKLRTLNKENFKIPVLSFGRIATRGRGNKRNVSSQW